MKLKFDKALSLVAIGVLSVIGSAQAASVYEIVNIEDYDLNGTLDGTRNGYAMAVNDEDELVGISKGKNKLSIDDVDDSVIDIEDGITAAESITYSVYSEIEANNFTFISSDNASVGSWVPEFFSMAGTFDPASTETDSDDELIVNDVDTFFYGINNNGVKVGAYTGPELTLDYEGTSTTQEYFYYREFEMRGIAVKNDVEYPLLPSFTTYDREQTADVDAATVEVGGWSLASRVNNNNLVVGYGSTALASSSETRIDKCIEDAEDTDASNPIPTDICVQAWQYPDTNGTRYIQYQTRGMVWDLDNIDENGLAQSTELPLGLTPDEDSTLIFTSQGLGINSAGDVAGRSHVYRNGDDDDLYFDAAYWKKDSNGNYQYNWVEMDDKVYYSIAYDINDSGILVGSYSKYISGYLRSKFFMLDTNNPEEGITTPNDFQTSLSDLSSKPKDINNKGQVVGYIESTYDKEKPRPKVAFLYDSTTAEFVNLNNQLTCESKGYERNTEGDWVRHSVSVQDGTGEILTYNTEISVVEANSINEDGTIVGTAFILKPEYQYDSTTGDLIIGENGLPLFELDGNGEPVTSYLPRMVVLKATAGEPCSTSDAVEDVAYERKGAASFAWLFALPLLWLRRRVKK
ncbi:DUF3466 family protein [Shewanella sp. MF05960]|uniref:DUF3466 family protein n=1 Tax=Shewanella sp. MF05960 TaxID=3434874 RepID=UPI003D7ABD99